MGREIILFETEFVGCKNPVRTMLSILQNESYDVLFVGEDVATGFGYESLEAMCSVVLPEEIHTINPQNIENTGLRLKTDNPDEIVFIERLETNEAVTSIQLIDLCGLYTAIYKSPTSHEIGTAGLSILATFLIDAYVDEIRELLKGGESI